MKVSIFLTKSLISKNFPFKIKYVKKLEYKTYGVKKYVKIFFQILFYLKKLFLDNYLFRTVGIIITKALYKMYSK